MSQVNHTLFYYSFINGDLSPYTIGILRQTNLGQEAIRLTAGCKDSD